MVSTGARLLRAGAPDFLRSPAARVWLLALFLDLGGVALLVGPLQHLPRFQGHGEISWPLLAVFFLISEVLAVHLEVRRSAHTFSLSEIPTVMALFFAGPTELVTARLAGSAIVFIFVRRNSPMKLAFNLGLFAWETSIAVWFFRSVVQGAEPVDSMGWTAALGAMLASSVVAVVVINTVIALHQGSASFLQLGEALSLGLTVTLVNTCMALLFVIVIWHQPESAWLMVIPIAALYFAYRSAQSERQKRKSITHLYDLGRELQGTVKIDAVMGLVTTHGLAMFNAEWAELVVAPEGAANGWRRAYLSSADRRLEVGEFAPEGSELAWFEQQLSTAPGAAKRQDPAQVPYLASRGRQHVLVASLRSETHSLGLLLMARRKLGPAWFDSEERELLETLASQTSAALETARLAEQLRAAEELSTRLGRIIDQSPSDVYLVESSSLKLMQANRAATKRLGYSSAEMVGMPLADLLYGGDRVALERYLAPLRGGRQAEVLLEANQRRRDGGSYPVEARIQITESTEPELFLVISQDVSERNEALKAREESREKSRFLAAMSHELRTPLNSILGFSQLLLIERDPLSNLQKDYVTNVMNSGQHLLRLINDLLDLSKVQAGKMEVNLDSVFIGSIFEDVLATVSELARAKGLRLEGEGDQSLIALADPLRLRQVLLNLLSNAIKFTDSGSVRLVATSLGSELRLDVRDTGVGIDADDLEKVFEDFSQAKTGRSKAAQGTGLGLPISRQLTELMGGHIEVTSKVGEGTVFSVTLPQVARTVKPATEAGAPRRHA